MERTHSRLERGRKIRHPALSSHLRPAPRLVARPSRIHGMGLFAEDSFRKGELIGRFEGPPAKRDGKYLFLLECQPDEDWPGLKEYLWGHWWKGIRVTNLLKYSNHSSHPNAEARGLDLVAIRPVAAGDEITWHYGQDWND